MQEINDINNQKKALRQKFKELRRNISNEDKEIFDEKIFKNLISTDAFKKSDEIYIYVATEIEVETKKVIEIALSEGKKVAVPYCIDGTSKMDFYYIKDIGNDLKRRSFGILEPIISRCKKAENFGKNSLCVVPGLAFDKNGYRLGYGRGYYDRFLSYFNGSIYGLVYASCLEEALPIDKYDKNVHVIVTERSVINIE